jgi:ketosteroid isomerase-like protein
MSQENVETLRTAYVAFSRGDLDSFLDYLDPNVEVDPGLIAPDQSASRYVGRQEVRKFLETIVVGPWEAVITEPLKMIEIDDSRVLSIDRWHFRGRDGIEIEMELPNLFSFRDGRIVRIHGFTDRAKALEAVGLSEQDARPD